uniref:Uncharacterized protein n=1 Tax=viral metagenome TaxID=1070528 RepID=A0A6M3L9B6_9ZZZZ
MKKLLITILIIVFVFIGCTMQKFTIPDEPIYKEFSITRYQDGVCMETADFVIFQSNIDKLWNYVSELRILLEELQSGVKAVEANSNGVVVKK